MEGSPLNFGKLKVFIVMVKRIGDKKFDESGTSKVKKFISNKIGFESFGVCFSTMDLQKKVNSYDRC